MSGIFVRGLVVVTLFAQVAVAADKPAPIFSGPQVGEKLPGFKVKGVFDEAAGKQIDLISQAGGKPIVLVFVHARTRPAFGLTNTLMRFVASRAKDGLTGGIVFLTDDPTATETWMKRIRQHFPKGVSLGISADGQEGPGSYGLNRNVTLTVLVAKDNKVTANFALVQPSEQADGPKIFKAIVDALGGGKVPKVAEFSRNRYVKKSTKVDVRALLGPVINKQATREQVDAAAAKVEEAASKDKAVRVEIGRVSRTVVNSGKLGNYGTPAAQAYLRKWAKQYGGTKSARSDKKSE